jgi:hypothetical protein
MILWGYVLSRVNEIGTAGCVFCRTFSGKVVRGVVALDSFIIAFTAKSPGLDRCSV